MKNNNKKNSVCQPLMSTFPVGKLRPHFTLHGLPRPDDDIFSPFIYIYIVSDSPVTPSFNAFHSLYVFFFSSYNFSLSHYVSHLFCFSHSGLTFIFLSIFIQAKCETNEDEMIGQRQFLRVGI